MMKTFHRSPADACDIADSVHVRGQAIAGVYALDIAETKVTESHDWAKQEGHPLVLATEPDD